MDPIISNTHTTELDDAPQTAGKPVCDAETFDELPKMSPSIITTAVVATEQPPEKTPDDFSCVRDYTFFELCQTFPSHCKADDSTLERFLANGPYGEEDPVLVLSYNDENIGSKVVPGAASIQQKKNLIINALVANGGQRIGESETAFFFPTWNTLWLARENMTNPTLPNNVHWAFSVPLHVSLLLAANGINAPVTPTCVHCIIIRTVTDEPPDRRTPPKYLVDRVLQFFDL